MSNPYLLKVNDIWAKLKGRTNGSVYINAGIDAAELTTGDWRLSYQRIDKGNPANNTASGETTAVSGSWGDGYLVNRIAFGAATGVTGDNVTRIDFPNAAFAAGADSVICTIRNVDTGLRLSTTIELLHPPILENVIEERPGAITSSIITLAGSPGVQRYIVIYTQFVSTAYQFGKEIVGTTLGIESFGGPEERVLLPIHGSYYQDGLGDISQIHGLARSMGVTSDTDLQQAGWVGATLETLAGAGYTFIVPISTGFTIPGSFVDLILLPNDTDLLSTERIDLSGYPEGAVYYKNSATNTNTLLGTDGTINNPVGSYTAVKSLADALGSKSIIVEGLLVINVSTSGYSFKAKNTYDSAVTTQSQLTVNTGINWLGNTVRDLAFTNAIGTFNDKFSRYYQCEVFGNNSTIGGVYWDCIWNTGNIYVVQSETNIIGGATKNATSTITFDVGLVTEDLNISGLQLHNAVFRNITTNNVVTLNVRKANVTLEITCTGGVFNAIGDIKIDASGATTALGDDLNGLLHWNSKALEGANMIETDSGDSRWTQKALEEAPVAGAAPTVPQIVDGIWDELKAGHTDAGSFGESVNSNLVSIEGSDTIDTISLTEMFENIISALQGNVVRGGGGGNTYTYKKQDGTTTTFSYVVSAGGRI